MKIPLFLSGLIATSILLIAAVVTPAFVNAADPDLCAGANLSLGQPDGGSACKDVNGDGVIDGEDTEEGASAADRVSNLIKLAVNILTVIVGVAAVFLIIINGFRFITSEGDPAKVATARTGIIYSLVGLVVVAFAQVIVKFVINKTA